jgi:hypothetical protein
VSARGLLVRTRAAGWLPLRAARPCCRAAPAALGVGVRSRSRSRSRRVEHLRRSRAGGGEPGGDGGARRARRGAVMDLHADLVWSVCLMDTQKTPAPPPPPPGPAGKGTARGRCRLRLSIGAPDRRPACCLPLQSPEAGGTRPCVRARARHTRFFSLVTTLKKLPADHQAPAGSICPVQKAKEAVGRCCCCATDSPAAGDGSRRGRILLFAARAEPWRGEATGGASVSRNPRRGCAAPRGCRAAPRRASPSPGSAGLLLLVVLPVVRLLPSGDDVAN